MNILNWLNQNNYDYTWNFKLSGKTPDIIGFKNDEIIAFEFKKNSTEISTAIGQCLQYRKQANKVYIVLPSSEKNSLQKIQLSTLKKYGIGLILYNDELNFLIKAKDFPFFSGKLIDKLKQKSMTGVKLLNSEREIKQEILNLINKHPEGLSIQEIAKKLNIHRHTASKYISYLEGTGKIFVRKIGSINLVYRKEDAPSQKGLTGSTKLTIIIAFSLVLVISSISVYGQLEGKKNETGLGILTQIMESVSVEKTSTSSKSVVEIANKTIETPTIGEPTLKSSRKSFSLSENPVINLKYSFKKSVKTGKSLAPANKIQNGKWVSSDESINVKIIGPSGSLLDSSFVEIEKKAEGDFDLRIKSTRETRAGVYTIQTTVTSSEGETFTKEDQFAWGLVSMNTRKSIYKSGENAELIFVVLDSQGHPVCNSDIKATIRDPSGTGNQLTTSSGTIKPNSECGLYDAEFKTSLEGNHTIDVTATANGIDAEFSSYFLVQNNFDYDIIRTAQSKIDPVKNPNSFKVSIDLQSFVGSGDVTIREYVPAAFDVSTDGKIEKIGDTKIITWNKNLGLFSNTKVEYTYSVPQNYPRLYALGKVEVEKDKKTFTEARNWFVAVDPPANTIMGLKTVEFFVNQSGGYNYTAAGNHSGSISGGNWWNSSFNIILPEDRIQVKSAWFEVYGSNLRGIATNLQFAINGTNLPIFALPGGSEWYNFRIIVNGTNGSTTPAGMLYGISDKNQFNSFNFSIKPNTGGAEIGALSVKAVLTYEYDTSSATKLQTDQFFINVTDKQMTSNGNWTSNRSISLSGESIAVKNAWYEIGGITNGASNLQTQIFGGGGILQFAKNISVSAGTAESESFLLNINASNSTETSPYSINSNNNFVTNLTFRCSITATVTCNGLYAKLFVAYTTTKQNQTTLEFYANSSAGIPLAAGNFQNYTFPVQLLGDNPKVQNAFFEIDGGLIGTANTMNVRLNNTDLGIYVLDYGLGESQGFRIYVNGTNKTTNEKSLLYGITTNNITYWDLGIGCISAVCHYLNAKLVITYNFTSDPNVTTTKFLINTTDAQVASNAYYNTTSFRINLSGPSPINVLSSWYDIGGNMGGTADNKISVSSGSWATPFLNITYSDQILDSSGAGQPSYAFRLQLNMSNTTSTGPQRNEGTAYGITTNNSNQIFDLRLRPGGSAVNNFYSILSVTYHYNIVLPSPMIPQFLGNHTFQNQNLEDDNTFSFITGSNTSFQINVTDGNNNLANASISLNNTNYTEYVSNQNLTSWIPFNDVSGTNAIDRTGSGHNGTLGTGVAWHTGANCTFGSCVMMDGNGGSGNSVNVENTQNSQINASFTLITWLKLGTNNAAQDRIVDNEDAGPADGFALRYSNDMNLLFDVRMGVTDTAQIEPVGYNQTDVWKLWALVFSNQSQTSNLYVDGVLVGTDATTQMSPSSEILKFGRRTSVSTNQANMTIDDARLYFRALNQSEVLALYQAARGGGNLSQVYQMPTDLNTSTFFINFSTPAVGTHNFSWYGFDFNNNQNTTGNLTLIITQEVITTQKPFFTNNNTYQGIPSSMVLENDNTFTYANKNVSLEINVTDFDNNLANATIRFNNTNYTVNVTNLNMTAWITFNEETANASDRTGNYTVITYNSPNKLPLNASVPGFGRAMSFDDTDDFVTINGTGGTLQESFSVAAWVNISTNIDASDKIVQKSTESGGSSIDGFILLYSSTASLRLNIKKGGAVTAAPDSGVVQNNSWYHVVGTFNNKTREAILYLNGTKVASDVNGAMGPNGNDVIIGRAANSADYWAGGIDDVRIWQRVLNESEVANIYFAQRGGVNVSEVYELPNTPNSSVFFINITPPGVGTHNFSWFATDFNNQQNTTGNLSIIVTSSTQTYNVQINETVSLTDLRNSNNFLQRVSPQLFATAESALRNLQDLINQGVVSLLNDLGFGNRALQRISSDLLSLRDLITASLNFLRTNINAITLTDLANVMKNLQRYLSDLLGVTNITQVTKTIQSIAGQTVSITDFGNGLRGIQISTSQTITATDFVSVMRGLQRYVSDLLSITNINQITKFMQSVSGQTISFTDFGNGLKAIQISMSQTLTANDIATAIKGLQRYVSESLRLTDVIQINKSLQRVFSELLNLTNITQITKILQNAFGQTISITDLGNGLRAIQISMSQSITANDFTSVIKTLQRFVNESLSLANVTQVNKNLQIYISETLRISDLGSRLLALLRIIFDLLFLTETAQTTITQAGFQMFFADNHTFQNQNLEDDNTFVFISGSNASFQINVTDNPVNLNLANATFELDGVNYTEYVSNQNLTSWIPFNDVSAAVSIDRTGSNHTGILGAGVAWHTGANCTFGSCVFLDGNGGGGNIITVDNTEDGQINDSFTWIGWLKFGTDNTAQDRLVDNENLGPTDGFTLRYSSDMNLLFDVRKGGNPTAQIEPIGYNQTDVWKLWALVFNNQTNTSNLYVDGVLVGTDASTQMSPSSNSLKYGRRSGQNQNQANMTIDDAKLYFRALNQSEVLATYQAARGGGNLSQVYQMPDGNTSSTFFINQSTPAAGTHTFRWYAIDFTNNQNRTDPFLLTINSAFDIQINLTLIYQEFRIATSTLQRSLGNIVVISDFSNGLKTIQEYLSQKISATDFASTIKSLQRYVSETLGFSDLGSRLLSLLRIIFELLGLTNIVEVTANINPEIFFTSNHTYQNQNLEDDNIFTFIGESNVSFEINVSDRNGNLANSTFEIDGTNYTEVSQDGLQAWWKFNENRTVGSRIIDYTGHGYDGSLSRIPNVTWAGNSSGAATGKFGDALYFKDNKPSASHGFVALTASGQTLNITNQFTISFWVYNNQSGSSWLMSKRVGFGGSGGCNFRTTSLVTNSGNTTTFHLCTAGDDGINGNGTSITSSGTLASSGWTNVIATYNASYMVLYFDGGQQAIAYKTGDLNFTTDTWKIGSLDGGGSGGFNGTIDDFKIYNRSLNQSEVRQISETGNGGGSLNTVYQYPDGNFSSKFFINISTPPIGTHNFKWYGVDFTNIQNSTSLIPLTILDVPKFDNNNTYKSVAGTHTLENDNTFTFTNGANASFDINVTDFDRNLANATFELDGVNYTGMSTDEFMGWWKLNEGTGTTTFDSSGNNNTGSFSNNPEWITNSSCRVGNCLRFDGTNDLVDAGNASNLRIQSNLTISGWFNLEEGGNRWAVSKWRSGNTGESSYLLIPSYTGFSPARPCFFISNSTSTSNICTTGGGMPNNTWFHLAATFTSGSMKIYVNGALNNSGTTAITRLSPNSTLPVVLGQESTKTNVGVYKGIMDDIRIYNRTFNDTELKEIYEAFNGGGTLGRVYEFPDGNSSSRFFINQSTPSSGSHVFRWYATDFTNVQNRTDPFLLIVNTIYDFQINLTLLVFDSRIITNALQQSSKSILVISDLGNGLRSIQAYISETITSNIVTTVIKTLQRIFSELLNLNNITNFVKSLQRTTSQTLSFTDFTAIIQSLQRGNVNLVIYSDTASTIKAIQAYISETLRLNDVITVSKTLQRIFSELLSLTNQITRAFQTTFGQTIVITDFGNGLRSIQAYITQTISTNDFVSVTKTLQRFVSELLNLNQISTINLSLQRIFSELLNLTNINQLTKTLQSSSGVTLVINEVSGGIKTIQAYVTQALSLGDFTSITQLLQRVSSQLISLTDLSQIAKLLQTTNGQTIVITNLGNNLKSVQAYITQSITANEFASVIKGLQRIVSDLLSLQDAVSFNKGLQRYFSDLLSIANINQITKFMQSVSGQTISFTDFGNGLRAIIASFSESLSLTDISFATFVDIGQTFVREVAETLTIKEIAQMNVGLNRYFSDLLSITNITQFTKFLQSVAGQTVTFTDFGNGLKAIQISMSQTLTANDFVSVIKGLQRFVSESLRLTDVIQINKSLQRVFSELLNLTNITQITKVLQSTFGQVISFTDFGNGLKAIQISMSQTINVNEFASAIKTLQRFFSELLNLNELASIAKLLQNSATQTIVITQFSGTSKIITAYISQLMNLNQIVTLMKSLQITTIQILNLNELIASIRTLQNSFSQTIVITDFTGSMKAVQVFTNQVLNFNEFASITKFLQIRVQELLSFNEFFSVIRAAQIFVSQTVSITQITNVTTGIQLFITEVINALSLSDSSSISLNLSRSFSQLLSFADPVNLGKILTIRINLLLSLIEKVFEEFFDFIESVVITVTAGGGGGGGGHGIVTPPVVPEGNLGIMRSPVIVGTAGGATAITEVTVKNINSKPLTRVTLNISGIPSSWYTIAPFTHEVILSGESRTFAIVFNIPLDAKPKDYKINAVVDSETETEEFSFFLRVSQSVEKLDRPIITRSVSFDIERGKTDVMINVINPKRQYEEVKVDEKVEKSLANSTDYIDFMSEMPEIIQSDPEFLYIFEKIRAGEVRGSAYSLPQIVADLSSLIYWPFQQVTFFESRFPQTFSSIESVDFLLIRGIGSDFRAIIENDEDTQRTVEVSLELPDGWSTTPEKAAEIIGPGERKEVKLRINVPLDAETGKKIITVVYRWDGAITTREMIVTVYSLVEFVAIGVGITIVVMVAVFMLGGRSKEGDARVRRLQLLRDSLLPKNIIPSRSYTNPMSRGNLNKLREMINRFRRKKRAYEGT